jgi:hypothetical protein
MKLYKEPKGNVHLEKQEQRRTSTPKLLCRDILLLPKDYQHVDMHARKRQGLIDNSS